MKFNYTYLILLLISLLEVIGESYAPFGTYDETSKSGKLRLKMSNHICKLRGMSYDFITDSCIQGYYLDDQRKCLESQVNSSIRFNKKLNTTLCYYSYSVNPPYKDFSLPALLLPSAISRIEKSREVPLCQYNYHIKIRPFDDSSFLFSYETITDDNGEMKYQKCEVNPILPPPYCSDPCDVTYTNEEDQFPYVYSYQGFTEADIDKSAIFSIESTDYYISSDRTNYYGASDSEFAWCRCNPNIFSPNSGEQIKSNNSKYENFKLKMNRHICQLQDMTYSPEFDACIKSDKSLNNQNNCKGDDRWEEFNKELNSTVCNIKYKVHPPDNRYEVPAVLFPEALQTLTPTLKSNTLCRKRYHYKFCNDYYYNVCNSNEYFSECEGIYPDYPWNGCSKITTSCENNPFLPPPICREACDVTYTNEEDGFPASFLEANFTRSQMDTSVKFSIEAIGVQAKTPTYKFGWCVCDPNVSPPKAVPQVCCTGDECQGQSSLRRCCVNPVVGAADLIGLTNDQLFFYSKEEDGQECVYDIRKYKPQPGKVDILPTNSTSTTTTTPISTTLIPSSTTIPISTSASTSISSPTDVVDVDPSSPQNKLIQKLSEHMCKLQGMKYDSELKSCIKAYPLDMVNNCNNPGKEWEEFYEEFNFTVCHIRYELNPPNGNFEIPAVLLPEALKKVPHKSEKPLCEYQSYENSESEQIDEEEMDSKKCENSFLLPPPECQEACDVTYSIEEDGFPASFINEGFTSTDIDTSVKFSIEAVGMYERTPMYKFGWCRCNPNVKPPTAVKRVCCKKKRNPDCYRFCCTNSPESYFEGYGYDVSPMYLGYDCLFDLRKYKPEPGKIDVLTETYEPVTESINNLASTTKSIPPPYKTIPTTVNTKSIPSTFSSKTIPVEFLPKTIPTEFGTKTVPTEFLTKTVPNTTNGKTIPNTINSKTVPTEFITETVTMELKTKNVPVTVTKQKTVTMTITLTGDN